MGSGTFFSKLAGNPLFQSLGLPGSHKYEDTLPVQVGPNTGPYTGVDATLAGANAGYRAGGPGSTAGTPSAPTVYGAAGQGHGSPGGFWGTYNALGSPFASAGMGISDKLSGAVAGDSTVPTGSFTPSAAPGYAQNPYVMAARGAAQQNPKWGNS